MRPAVRSLVALLIAASFLLLGAPLVFAEEGVATWYGPGFQGNKMANGQIYDMYDPTTAAANGFPFGTWLKVTNVANGKTIVVQVRDRGAFNHALDLSYAAFAVLDDPARMVVRVRYEVVSGPEAVAKQPAVPAPPQPAPAPSPIKSQQPPQTAAKPGTPAPTTYSLVRGDTLSRIAERFETTVDQLLALNSIANPNLVRVGEKLRLSPPPGKASGPASKVHVVQSGETLGAIALRYGLSVELLVELNGLANPDRIAAGHELRLSSDRDSGGSPAPNGPKRYVVQTGDTLFGIALERGTTVKAIRALNDLADENLIQPGQVLRLP